MTTQCPKCSHEIELGEHPFCPHGRGIGTAVPDSIVGGMWLENYGPNPIKVYSHSERRKIMNTVQYDKTTGQPYILTERETFAPLPGTDRDAQGIPNPNGYRALDAAAIIARNGRTSVEGESEYDPSDPNDIPNDPTAIPPEGAYVFRDHTTNRAEVRQLIRDLHQDAIQRGEV